MKAPEHQVRGMLFICACLFAGLILYMFLSRAPREPSTVNEAAVANDQAVDATPDNYVAGDPRESNDGSEDIAGTPWDPDEAQVADDGDDIATGSADHNANQVGEMDQATVRTPCSGEWSIAPNGSPRLSIKPNNERSGTFYTYVNDELSDFGPYFGTPNLVLFNIEERNQSFRMVCNQNLAEIEIRQGNGSETLKVYRVP